jgi:hypothetical protein
VRTFGTLSAWRRTHGGNVVWRIVTERRSATPASVAAIAVALLALGFAVNGSHVAHGGFYSDDWSRAAAFRFEGYVTLAADIWHVVPGRPVHALLAPLPHALFGLDPRWHLAAAIVLAVSASVAFFVFLRALGVAVQHAAWLSALALLFPWSGTARLWSVLSISNVALVAYFVGTTAALGAFSARGRRRRVYDLAASVLYLLSILTYEVAAAAILCSGILYRSRSSWRGLRSRWFRDAALVVITLIASLVTTSRVRYVGSPADRVTDIPRFVREDVSIFASSFLPRSWASTLAQVLVLVATAAVVATAILRARNAGEVLIRRWLAYWGIGVAGVALAHLVFLGTTLSPLDPGISDRVNIFAAFGFVVAAYSTLALVVLLLAPRAPAGVAAILLTAAMIFGVTWIQRTRAEIRRYDDAPALQRDVLARLGSTLRGDERRGTVVTFGYPAYAAPGVPIFAHSWDLSGALRLQWNDSALKAFPVYRHGVVCGANAISSLQLDDAPPGRYGDTVFVDLAERRAIRIRSRRECRRALRTFRPGSVYLRRSRG